jgi:hypothetical protein
VLDVRLFNNGRLTFDPTGAASVWNRSDSVRALRAGQQSRPAGPVSARSSRHMGA